MLVILQLTTKLIVIVNKIHFN